MTWFDEFIDDLLTQERVCDIILPRLTQRSVLEETEGLPPRKSLLVSCVVPSLFLSPLTPSSLSRNPSHFAPNTVRSVHKPLTRRTKTNDPLVRSHEHLPELLLPHAVLRPTSGVGDGLLPPHLPIPTAVSSLAHRHVQSVRRVKKGTLGGDISAGHLVYRRIGKWTWMTMRSSTVMCRASSRRYEEKHQGCNVHASSLLYMLCLVRFHPHLTAWEHQISLFLDPSSSPAHRPYPPTDPRSHRYSAKHGGARREWQTAG